MAVSDCNRCYRVRVGVRSNEPALAVCQRVLSRIPVAGQSASPWYPGIPVPVSPAHRVNHSRSVETRGGPSHEQQLIGLSLVKADPPRALTGVAVAQEREVPAAAATPEPRHDLEQRGRENSVCFWAEFFQWSTHAESPVWARSRTRARRWSGRSADPGKDAAPMEGEGRFEPSSRLATADRFTSPSFTAQRLPRTRRLPDGQHTTDRRAADQPAPARAAPHVGTREITDPAWGHIGTAGRAPDPEDRPDAALQAPGLTSITSRARRRDRSRPRSYQAPRGNDRSPPRSPWTSGRT